MPTRVPFLADRSVTHLITPTAIFFIGTQIKIGNKNTSCFAFNDAFYISGEAVGGVWNWSFFEETGLGSVRQIYVMIHWCTCNHVHGLMPWRKPQHLRQFATEVGYVTRIYYVGALETLCRYFRQRTSCGTCAHVVILERQAFKRSLLTSADSRIKAIYVPQVSFTTLTIPGIFSLVRTYSFRQLSKSSNGNYLPVYQTIARDYSQGCYTGLECQPLSPMGKEL